MKFLPDANALPASRSLISKMGEEILFPLFNLARTWCYEIHTQRWDILKLKKTLRYSYSTNLCHCLIIIWLCIDFNKDKERLGDWGLEVFFQRDRLVTNLALFSALNKLPNLTPLYLIIFGKTKIIWIPWIQTMEFYWKNTFENSQNQIQPILKFFDTSFFLGPNSDFLVIFTQ